MLKTTVKFLLFFTFFTVFAATRLFAQATITIGAVDAGPYSPGSTVSIPFHINSSTGIIDRTNTFSLYMSDIGGATFPATPVATMTGFYGNYFNYTIPAGTPVGNYKFMVTASNPAITTSPSNDVTIAAGTAPTAATTTPPPQIITTGVFGRCGGTQATPYTFSNTSTNADNVTITFFDESGTTSVQVGAVHDITTTPFAFTAGAKNYRVLVTATDGVSGLVSTRSYQLINNNVTTNLGSTGSNVACIDPLTNEAIFTFSVDYTSATGVQNNYPGNTYPVTWGDGTTTTYTLGEIIAANGLIQHPYTTVSCGQVGSNASTNNRFRVDLNAVNPYCGTNPVGSPSTGYATITVKPVNRIGNPTLNTTGSVCTGSNMTFVNLSIPGPDATSTTIGCTENPNALYTWLVDGIAVLSNVPRSTNFTYSNIPRGLTGTHTITLRDVSGNGQCFADDVDFTLCVQNPPQPSFTLPTAPVCLTDPVIPTITSVIDNNCSAPGYSWLIYQADGVTPATGVTYLGGTTVNSEIPQFKFANAGIYKLQLTITTTTCGAVLSTQQTVTIEAAPTADLSQNYTLCGKSYTLTFDNTNGATKTTFTGTPTTDPATTYTWTVTGGAYSFAGGTDLHSKYPQIYFDNFATYTITVTHTNTCGPPSSDTQEITFLEAPTVSLGGPQTVCYAPGVVVHLNGIIGGTYTTSKWIKDVPANGNFVDENSPATDYVPTADDFTRGYVTLVLHAYNNASGSCSDVSTGVVITLIRTTTGTSATTKKICSGSDVNYNITTNNDAYTPAPTFAWTATVTSGAVTGFTAAGTTKLISDILVNTNPTVAATVTYHITPSTSGCPGTPFDLVVTIPAVPVVTPARAAAGICSNNAAGITMTSSLTGTRYTWTVSAPAGITGATGQTSLTSTAAITNTLINTTSGTLTVNYTITPYNTDGCPGTPVPISVDVYAAPTVSIAGPTQNLCGATSALLAANPPLVVGETGKWSAVTGLTFFDDTDPHTTVSGLVDGGNYTLTWTITTGNTCSSSSNVNISVTAASVGGTTAGATTICSGSNGNITLSGQVGNIVRWQRSIDAGANWINVTNTTTTLSYTNLTQTTHYRAEVQSGTCPSQFSDVSIVTVNAPTPQAAIVGADQELCNASGTTLTAQANLGYTGKWTQTAGPTTGVIITDDTNPTTTVTGLTGGTSSNVYTFTWTVNGLSPCGNTSAAVNVTNYAASAGGTTGTTDATTVCSGSNAGTINLTGKLGTILNWERSTDGGTTWQTIAVTTTSISFTNLTQTTQYRAVVQNGTCTSASSTITTITVNQPAPAAIAGINQILCNVTTTVLDATAPGGAFVGQWSQTSGPTTGVSFSNVNDPKATVTGLSGDNIYTFTWTILANAPCTNTSQSITVNVSAATVAGNTIGNTTVCAGDNNGQVTLTGHHGSILYWEKSEDTGTTWTTINNTTATVSYLNITQTTQYRARVKNGSCIELTTPLVVIRVNQPAPPADAGPNQILCNQPTVNLLANDPGAFTGTWTQISGPAVNIVSPNNYQTTVTGLTGANNYVFRWTITALAPCVDTRADVTITNNPDIVASFTSTAKVGCGDLTVRFTNTSNNQPLANFIWNFGDGQTSSLASPQHTFAQRTDGRDTTYYISLGIIGNCINRPEIVDSILVRPATPLARILPATTNGCGNFALEVRNTSPGNNVSYDFYLYDGSTLVQKITRTDKSSVIFDPITTVARKVFTLYMIATGYCNNTNETTHIPIAISPSSVVAQMVIQAGINSGCAPLKTTFFNNSFGGDNFYYTIYDANNNVVDKPIGGLTSLPYTFNRPGTYYVTITAISNCGLNESTRTRIDVYATPTPSFVANITSACKDGLITFTNNTLSNDPNTTATSLIYDWDFGDGSPHSALYAPSHGYHYRSTPYTVTLRATNTTSGCTDVFVRTAYINIYGPPKTAFTIKPDSVTSIPNYSFSFTDATPADAASWKWTFGDGQTSTRRNPTVTYADTGVYKVTLTTATANGCDSTITRTVKIGGVPGQLFLPNAFMPESATTELKMFMAKGSGIKTWQLQIFNNYGQLVWQTTKLSSKGEPEEGWDGTFKGVPAPQGVYQWQASASFINGTEWKGNSYKDELPKRVGSVHLIR